MIAKIQIMSVGVYENKDSQAHKLVIYVPVKVMLTIEFRLVDMF